MHVNECLILPPPRAVRSVSMLRLFSVACMRPTASGVRHARIHAAAVRAAAGDTSHSVSGVIYAAPRDPSSSSSSPAPIVELFTKANCPLCDDAKAVLQQCATDVPHSLVAVDITDSENRAWWERYKYDIPVLHLDGAYWAKHRIEAGQCAQALRDARDGRFVSPAGQPGTS